MNGVFSGRSFPIPEAVTPLFVGFCASASVVRQHREVFRRHIPIGCRDIATMLLMHEHGIDAYVSGCVTMTFAPRTVSPEQTRLFIVYGARAGELPASALPHVPPHLLERAVLIDHRLPVCELPLGPAADDWITRYEAHLLRRCEQEATVVLTPLLTWHRRASP